MKSIAIIGAGLAGITLARQLSDEARVTVFEKSRGFGGRMATRRFDSYQFDHGAQFFTARSEQFNDFLMTHITDNCVWLWEPRIVTLATGKKPFKREWFEAHYIAAPGMNELVEKTAIGLNVKLHTEIASIEKLDSGWRLKSADGNSLGDFDWVVCSAPAPQTATLLPLDNIVQQQMAEVKFSPCFCLMLGFSDPVSLHFDAAVVRDSAISWIAVNSSKIDRLSGYSLVIHSDNDWAMSRLDLSAEEIVDQLMESLRDLLGSPLPEPDHTDLHRWRYARTEVSADRDFLLDENRQLAACGEWCRGNRVEDAYLSGLGLGEKLRTLL